MQPRHHGNGARGNRAGHARSVGVTPRIMKNSTHDRIEGRAKQVRGKAKIAAGKVTGSRRLKAKGHADVAEGKAQKRIGDVERARGC